MMEFLYFPEDRTEYLPAAIILILVILATFIVFYLIRKQSMKQEQKLKEFESKIMSELDKNDIDTSNK